MLPWACLPGRRLGPLQIQTSKGRQKYSARPITLAHDEILKNKFLQIKCGTLQMRIAVSRDLIAQRARELLAHTYVPILDWFTFSTVLQAKSLRPGLLTRAHQAGRWL